MASPWGKYSSPEIKDEKPWFKYSPEGDRKNQEVSTAMDVAQAAGSGAVRGAIGTAELPEMLARGVLRGGQEALQYFGYDVGEDIPVLQTATGQALRDLTTLDDYEAQTRAGKFAGTQQNL